MNGGVMMRRHWLADFVFLWMLLMAVEAGVKGDDFELRDKPPSVLEVYRFYVAGHLGVGFQGVEFGVRSITGVSLAFLSMPWDDDVTAEWENLLKYRYQFSWKGYLLVGVMGDLAVWRSGPIGVGARSLLMWGLPVQCDARKFEVLVPGAYYNQWIWRPYPNFPRPCARENRLLVGGVGTRVVFQWSGNQAGVTAWLIQRGLMLGIPEDLAKGFYPPDPPPSYPLGLRLQVAAYVEIKFGR